MEILLIISFILLIITFGLYIGTVIAVWKKLKWEERSNKKYIGTIYEYDSMYDFNSNRTMIGMIEEEE